MTGTGSAGFAPAWDTYWRGTRENAAHKEGGVQEALLVEFWRELLQTQLARNPDLRVLDLACGNGAVTGFVRQISPALVVHCCDYSLHALVELERRHPGNLRVVADAARLPYADASIDLVASQYGVEYAGADAIVEAARLVAPGGTLALLLHVSEGAIYRECERNRDVVNAIRALDILALARSAFAAGFALNAGTATPETFKQAEQAFTPAVRGLEEILREAGPTVAGGLPGQLYRDIAHMYRKMSAYDPAEILGWLEGMARELDAYQGRMQSMLDAALPRDQLLALQAEVQAMGFAASPLRSLTVNDHSPAAAWALVMQRR
ncbi:class I SAM-dependent methyltransferase [Haliea sp. E1-2-M8]|uniref:class I SAM-dependent methyltransferase n=1 Tax=Haliea sp. E1-2-M8 TaxID=3064706 RepID=UPI00271CB68F|nr:class I SAM-dependent methyltransferase [Haliea sp. E1-2-M8]MDO8860216.1 class I SAM-dependent methyltransferase [Haliea sp. E1-2-M8]